MGSIQAVHGAATSAPEARKCCFATEYGLIRVIATGTQKPSAQSAVTTATPRENHATSLVARGIPERDFIHKGDTMFSVKLAKQLIKAASDDVTKQVLNYVQVKDGVATVTDGHRMVNIEAPDEIDGLYHRKEVEVAAKVASAKKTEVVLSSLPKTDEETTGQYPNWEQIIPTNLDECRRVAFNATYLKEMCELAIASGDTKIEMHIPKYDTDYDGNLYDCCTTPVICFWSVGEAIGRGLLMPLHMRGGFLKWKGLLPSGKAAPKKREKVAA